MSGICSTHWKDETYIYITLFGKTAGKRPLGENRRRWKGIKEMNHKERGCENIDWIKMAQDSFQSAGSCDHGNDPSVAIKGRKILE
jgi:hypothetical protein